MPRGQPQSRILTQCDNGLCRKDFQYIGSKAHFERSTHHYCSRNCQNTVHGLAGTPAHKIWERAKKRAKQKGWEFNLSVHDIPPIPENCPVLGIPLAPNDVAGPLDSSPSIDRKNPSLGYVAGNIRIISNRANRLRSNATAYELRLVADDLEKVEAGWEPFLVGYKP